MEVDVHEPRWSAEWVAAQRVVGEHGLFAKARVRELRPHRCGSAWRHQNVDITPPALAASAIENRIGPGSLEINQLGTSFGGQGIEQAALMLDHQALGDPGGM